MSSVTVQFLIYVQPTPPCSTPPIIIPLTISMNVQVGVRIGFTIYALDYCGSSVTITSIIVAQQISGMTAGSLTAVPTNASLSYINMTWTPSVTQVGSQQLCVYAYNRYNF